MIWHFVKANYLLFLIIQNRKWKNNQNKQIHKTLK